MLDFLDVAIGLIFTFTLLSLIVSALSECISAMLSLRGWLLWRTIEKLVGEKLRLRLEESPLIRGLAQGRLVGRPVPSYLEAEMFSRALLQQGFKALPKVETEEVPRDLSNLKDGLHALMAKPDEVTRDEMMNDFSRVGPALLALIDDTVDISEAQRRISEWYDAVMDRLSGVYKRWMQVAMFVIGLVVASGFGIDACAITESLWKTPSLRDSTVDMAAAFVEFESQKEEQDELPEEVLKSRVNEARAYAATLQESRLPLYPIKDRENLPDWLHEHWLGVLLSALATAMGAPFWFDLLGRFVNLRMSVKPTRPQQPSLKQ